MKASLLALLIVLCFSAKASAASAPKTPDIGEVSASLATPKIMRDGKGLVTLNCDTAGATIRYTLDGGDPVPKTGPYLAPIFLPQGGTIKARAFSADRKQKSEVTEVKFSAMPGAMSPPSTLVPLTQDRDWPVYDWAVRHAAVTKIVNDTKPSLVFLGDSITQMFGGEPHDRRQPGTNVWDKYYGKRKVANLGFGYDYLENTLWRLQHGELDGAQAKVVVVHIGTNNSGKNSVEEIVAGVRAICSEINQRQAQAKIVLMGIFPRGPKPDATRAKLAEVNQQLARMEGQNGIIFMDIGAKFLEADGTISREVMGDFLHPTGKGYEIWAEAIEPTLTKLLSEGK